MLYTMNYKIITNMNRIHSFKHENMVEVTINSGGVVI